jgi:hypothetical protein
MSRRLLVILGALTLVLASPVVASAGMPSFTLTDMQRAISLSNLTRMRLEAISFFLAGLLLSAGIIQTLWNSLRKDLTRLPRLSYGKAFGVVILWGLLFVLVLTMISGARELMTPGAWEKKGLTYRLAQDSSEAVSRQITARYETMERLRLALLELAETHEGLYPEPGPSRTLPKWLEDVPTFPGQRYIYMGGRQYDSEFGGGETVVIYEGDAFGADRLVLLNTGSILWMPVSEIEPPSGAGQQ